MVPTCIDPKFRAIEKPFDADRPTILHVGTSENKNLSGSSRPRLGFPCRLRIVGKLSEAQRARLEVSGLEFKNEVGSLRRGNHSLLWVKRTSWRSSRPEGFGCRLSRPTPSAERS